MRQKRREASTRENGRPGESGAVVGASAAQFARAIVMPNLRPPVATVGQALAYRQRIVDALPAGAAFEPLMTLYLTDRTAVDEVARVAESGFVKAFKYYPAGATTNSDSGVTALKNVYPVLDAMQRHGVVLCIHGEVTDPATDVFDREAIFVEHSLAQVVRDFPALKVVVEHITTREATDFVSAAPGNVGATITPQHLLYNRTSIFTGGIRPHFYCLPILKRETHRQALLAAATSGSPKFFLGTDSAPHSRNNKETCCGAAGCFTSHAAIELYAEAFDAAHALDKLEAFASFTVSSSIPALWNWAATMSTEAERIVIFWSSLTSLCVTRSTPSCPDLPIPHLVAAPLQDLPALGQMLDSQRRGGDCSRMQR